LIYPDSQTITRGVTFNFTDLKQMFYAHEQVLVMLLAVSFQYQSVVVQVLCLYPSPCSHQARDADYKELHINYRTHQNILDLANSIAGVVQVVTFPPPKANPNT
jgi:hypothetical protein